MSLRKYLQGPALAALAAAIVVAAVPAEAQDRGGRNRIEGRNSDGNAARRSQRVEQRGEQRAAQIDRRSEQRAARIEQRGDQAARQQARQGNWDQARRTDRRTEQAARQVERNGDTRAARVERQANQDARQVERNRTYADQSRNRTYATRSTAGRDNDGWRSNDRNDNRYTDSNNYRRDNYRQWDRQWRNNNRYDWQRYRTTNRTVYRLGVYYAPYRNYSYRRIGYGNYLQPLFFGSTYWLNDPWQYRLPAVYGPYRWVRYYDDVLLVDIYSGQVVDVIYDFFW